MRRGQMSIIAIILVFVGLAFFVGMLPALNKVINTALPQVDDMTATMLSFVIPLIAVGIIVSFWFYVSPNRGG